MFVESMSMNELRAEFEREKKSVIHKALLRAKQHQSYMRKYNVSSIDKMEEFRSARKNTWYILFGGGKKDMYFSLYCFFHVGRSYSVLVYAIADDRLMYYTSHFFSRYNERMRIDANKTLTVIESFVRENYNQAQQAIMEMKPGLLKVFTQMKMGVGLGYFHVNDNLLELRTFVTNDMLIGSQKEISKRLEEQFNLEIVRERQEYERHDEESD